MINLQLDVLFGMPKDQQPLQLKNTCNTCSKLFGLHSAGCLPKLKRLALTSETIVSQPGCNCITSDGLERIELDDGHNAYRLEQYLMAAVQRQSIKSHSFSRFMLANTNHV